MTGVVRAVLPIVLVALAYAPAVGRQQLIETPVTTPGGGKGMMIRPAEEGPHPGVLYLHGSGDTVADSIGVLRLFARAGYVALDVDYLDLPAGGLDLEVIDKSLEYLNRSPHVRRGSVFLNGFSLGGRLALRLAATQRVLAVSAIAARTSAGGRPTVLELAEKLRVPVLLQHGTDDAVVPYEDSVLLEKRLRELRRKVELIPYPGVGHGNLPWLDIYRKVLTFFRDHAR